MNKVKDYKDAQAHYAKDDRGESKGAFLAFIREPSSMDQEPRPMFADGQLVQPNDDGSRPGYAGKESTKKLREYLSTLDPKTKVQPMTLSKKFDVARKHVYTILKEYPKVKTLGKKEAFKLNREKEIKKKLATPVDVPTPVSKLRNLGGNTRDYTSVRWPNDEVKNNYIKDFKQKRSGNKAGKSGLSNEKLAKKYFGKINTSTIASVERTNRVLQQELDLQYQKGDPQKFQIKRKKRLKKTANFTAGGTDDFPFHHIRQIGGEVPLTTDDIAVINKKMNSKLAPYNKPLNAIADAISDNITYSFEAMQLKQEGKALDYLKRVDELNNNAESIVKKAVKDLPKEYKNLIGFNKFYARTDEYGFPLDDKVKVEKIGGTKTTSGAIPLNDLTKDQASILRKQIKTDATAEKINLKMLNPKHQQLIKNQFCPGNKKGGAPGTCDIGEAMDNMLKQTNAVKAGTVKGAEAARIANKASKVVKFGTGKGLGAVLGPFGLGGEAVFEVAMAVPAYGKGKSGKRILGDSLLGLIPGVGQSAEEEFTEYATKDGMSKLDQQKIKDVNRFLELNISLPSAQKNISKVGRGNRKVGEKTFTKQYDEYSPLYDQFVGGPPSESVSTAFAEQDRINQQIAADEAIRAQQRNIAGEEDFMAASGGRAGLSGGDTSGRPPESGPMSQGLRSLIKNGRKL